jgi:hypothetical protein
MKANADKKRTRTPRCAIIEADMVEDPVSAFLSLFSSSGEEGRSIVSGEIILPMTQKKGRNR